MAHRHQSTLLPATCGEVTILGCQVSVATVPGDPNDDPIVQTALTGKADYLVTADTEVLRLGKIRSTEVITASEFALRLGLTEN